VYPFGADLYQKLPILVILGPVSPHFENHNGEIWHNVADPFPRQILEKCLRGYTLRGRFIKKFHILMILADFSPHFWSHNGEILP